MLTPLVSEQSQLITPNMCFPSRYDAFMIVGLDVFLFCEDNILGILTCKDFLSAVHEA